MTVAEQHTEYGDGTVARAGEILRTVVGSGVHGIAIEGTDDHDEMGVFIEPPEYAIGLRGPMSHYVYRTKPEGARSEPGDTDLVTYSLRRYLSLATKGNPTALLPLFAPPEAVLRLTPLGAELRALGPSMLSQQAVHRFLGYLQTQLDRMLGRHKGVPGRPELVARHGYDTKFASHALRLAHQGLEILRDGRLTLPMPEPERERERVRQVKRGEIGSRDEGGARNRRTSAPDRAASGRRRNAVAGGSRSGHDLGLVLHAPQQHWQALSA